MKLTKVMLVLLATVSAVLLKAEIRSWDFSNPAIWKEGRRNERSSSNYQYQSSL